MQRNDEDMYIIREKKAQKNEHHENESWAVSYSDLLMVLMSFFIVFFNMDDTPTDDGLNQLIYKFHNHTNLKEINPTTNELITKEDMPKKNIRIGKNFSSLNEMFDESKDKRAPSSLDKNVNGNFKKLSQDEMNKLRKENATFFVINNENVGAESKKATKGLLVDFSSDLYRVGEYELNEKSKKEIKTILENIDPKNSKFNLVFIGHSDTIPISGHRAVIDSNLILSSLRAAKAVEFAINLGYDPVWVSAQGVGEYTRNTRSLSLRVIER